MITHTYDLDIVHGSVPLIVPLSQYDSDFTLVFNLYSSEGEFTIENDTTASIRGTKGDGNGYSVDATINIPEKKVTVSGDQQMTAIAGKQKFELSLWKGEKELNTANFYLDVEDAALDKDDLISGSKIRELVNVIDRTDEIIAAATQSDLAKQQIQEMSAATANAAARAAQSAEDAEADAQEIRDSIQNAQNAIRIAKESALNEINQQYTTDLEVIQTAETDIQNLRNQTMTEITRKGEQIQAIATQADATASEALSIANNSENHMATLDSKMREVEAALNDVSIDPDDLGLEQDPDTYYVYPTYKGVRSENGIPLSAGGGGGGGGGETVKAILTVENQSGFLSKTIADGSSCPITITWSSVEDGMPTGDGTLRIAVNEVIRTTRQITQGTIVIDLASFVSIGNNKVKVRISDVYDQGRTITFNITSIALSISSTFDTTEKYSGPISFPYTPVGAVEKTVHFIVDGQEIATQTTSVTNRQMTQVIPAQTHGGHSLRVYFTAIINGETVSSNTLYYEFIFVESMRDDVIITSSFNQQTAKQYSSVPIPFMVYDPTSITAQVQIYANEELVSSQTVDRTEQSFTLRVNDAGPMTVEIKSGTTEKVLNFTVEESDIDVEAETENLSLYLTAQGRSNGEATREEWEYENISATLTGFTWRLDGWQTDADNITVLRVSDDARVTIPYKIFASDFKTSGKTIEIEFSTHEVSNYNANIISCFADNIGLKITPQSVTFKGAQTETNTLYKDNEHVRLSIVIEKQNENRLIYIYINGVMSRAVQYASGERFSQLTPVDISIGSDDCTVDIYNIRIYDNNLSAQQIVDNWIADTQDGAIMLERYTHNNVYDAYGNITIANLPSDLPYMIIEAEELPQYKGDKKTVTGSYTDPLYPSKSFTFEGCQINVQGTSSAVYYRKNYDMQFKNGFITSNGTLRNYALRTGSIPFNRFVLKADVASSESANNTELTMFYNDTCPYKVPEMIENPKVRWGIEGIPIVLFWHDTQTQETVFMGKYNFNLPKRMPEPLGYSGEQESWEWERNNSANVKFQDNDFTSQAWDEVNQKYYPVWYDDFEARFPSDEWRDYTKLNELLSWVLSTWRDRATGNFFDSDVVYHLDTNATVTPYIATDDSFAVVEEKSGGVVTGYTITFTRDTAAYRLTKFRAELGNYVEIDSATFYYLFTELFLMIDSRAKNMFVGFHGSSIDDSNRAMDRKAVFEPYDMDTAIGTNNSGVLMFGYYLEDTDTVSSIISGGDSGGTDAPVYNAQDSVLWSNFRDAFRDKCTLMFRDLRASNAWSYNAIEKRFEDHQAKWPESIFNEDSYVKYIVPLVDPVTVDEATGQLIRTDRYLTMLQGSKEEQRKWWLYNRFRYLDSKYHTGLALNNTAFIRFFNSGTLTLTSAIDMYMGVAFGGGSTPDLKRATANTPISYVYNQDSTVTEMETWIFSADLLTDIGDLSVFYPNEVDVSRCSRLKRLTIGNADANYSNANLNKLDVRNSVLLEYIDVRNCPNLAITLNMENATRLKEAYFDNTAITGIDLTDGGQIETLHLPGTITALTLINLNKLTHFVCPSYANISRLMLSNIDDSIVDPVAILNAIQANSQVNIQGLSLEMQSAEDIEDFLDLLDTMQGVTRERGTNGEWLYHTYDTAQVSGTIHTSALTGAQIASYNARYPYIRVTADSVISYLTYASYDGATELKTVTCLNGVPQEGAPSAPARASTAQYNYTFIGWSKHQDSETADEDAATDVIADRTIYAAYSKSVRTYTVTFARQSADGGGTLQTVSNVPYGGSATYTGATPTTTQGSAEDYPFEGWNPAPTNIQGNTTCYAKFGSPVEDVEITDSWKTIIANIENGTYATKYKIGNYKPLDLGTEGIVNMQIVGFDVDELADGTGYAPISFISKDVLLTKKQMNSVLSNVGGWPSMPLREYLINDIAHLFPLYIFSHINTVKKYSSVFSPENSNTETSERIWIPSAREVNRPYTRMESNGPIYKPLYYYGGPENQYKRYIDGNLVNWWFRSASHQSEKYFYAECKTQPMGVSANDNTTYICPGFCLGLEQETITDTWEQILQAEQDGTYSTKYSVGDTKSIDLGTYGTHLMEIVAFDADELADGTGNAKITWISKNIITKHSINSSGGVSGGWPGTEMRTWLIGTILSAIPSDIQGAIKEVNKTYDATGISTDKIWIPSYREVGYGANAHEESGPIYSARFTDDNSRKKRLVGGNSPEYWWLRTKSESTRFYSVPENGASTYNIINVTSSVGVVIGFCT